MNSVSWFQIIYWFFGKFFLSSSAFCCENNTDIRKQEHLGSRLEKKQMHKAALKEGFGLGLAIATWKWSQVMLPLPGCEWKRLQLQTFCSFSHENRFKASNSNFVFKKAHMQLTQIKYFSFVFEASIMKKVNGNVWM